MSQLECIFIFIIFRPAENMKELFGKHARIKITVERVHSVQARLFQ